jgi:hypothetical protein
VSPQAPSLVRCLSRLTGRIAQVRCRRGLAPKAGSLHVRTQFRQGGIRLLLDEPLASVELVGLEGMVNLLTILPEP